MNSPCPCGSGKKYKRCCGAGIKLKAGTSSVHVNDQQRTRKLVETAFNFQQYGDLASAAKIYEQLIAMHPGDSAFLGMRGMVAFDQKNYQEAENWLEKAIRLNQNDSRLHNFMGQVMVGLNESIEAERSFARAVMLDPDFFEAWCNLGMALLKSHQLLEAVTAFGKAISLSPDDAGIYLQLVEVHYLLGDLDKAELSARKAQSLGTEAVQAAMWLALVLRAKGKMDESAEAESLAKFSAKNAVEISNLLVKFGRVDVLVGNMEQAEYWLSSAMKINLDNPEPYIELADTRKFRDSDIELVNKMQSLSGKDALFRRRLEFALGKIFTDLGDYRRSFEHYRAANDFVRESVPFDPKAYIEDITNRIELFSKDRIAALPAGSNSDLPILIVGTPRSGTTLTEQIISSHSKVAGAGELSFWGRLGSSIMVDLPKRYNSQSAKTLATGYLNLLRTYSKSAERVTDKMPGNFNLLGLIHAAFPNTKIVHCRRHPIDACLSMYFQNFNDEHPYKFSLEGLVVFYEQYLRLMDHWRSVLPPGVMYEIQYEDLVEDTEGESRKLMEFLGLEWEEGQMDFFKKERPVFTCSKWQVRQPIYKTSRDRWRRYEEFIEPLLPLLKYAPTDKGYAIPT